jgi:two-component system response regulator YesN
MSVLRKLLSQSVFVKLLLIYLVTGILSLTLLSTITYLWFQKKSTEDIAEMNRLALNTISANISRSLDNYENLSYLIYSNSSVQELINGNRSDFTAKLNSKAYIVNLLVTNPEVTSVYITDGEDVVFRMSALYATDERSDEIMELVRNEDILTPIPRVIKTINGDLARVYSIIYHPSDDVRSGSAIVTIDADALNEEVFGENGNASNTIYIAGASGNVLIDNRLHMFRSNISKVSYFQKIQQEGGPSGSFQEKMDGRSYSVNYAYYSKKKLYVITLTDSKTMTGRLTDTLRILLSVYFGVLLLLFIASIVVSLRFYLPISNIFGQIKKSVKQGKEETKPIGEFEIVSNATLAMIERMNELDKLKEFSLHAKGISYLRNFLTTDSLIRQVNLEETLQRFEIKGPGNLLYGVVVVSIDNYRMFVTNHTQEVIELQLNKVGSIAVETLKAVLVSKYYLVDQRHLVLICELNEGEREVYVRVLRPLLEKTQDTVYRYLRLEVTSGISALSGDWTRLRELYRTALHLTNYRFFYGKRSVLNCEQLEHHGDAADLRPLMKHIVKMAKRADRDSYSKAVEEMILASRNQSYTDALKAYADLAYTLLRMTSDSQTEYDFVSVHRYAMGLEDPRELKDWFDKIYNLVRESMDLQQPKGTQQLVENVLNIIEQNFSDPTFSANAAAELLGITPQYFGRILKEHTGLTFPDYLNNLRLEQARALIHSGTSTEIKQICERVGYNNRTYFTTLFKNKFGVTPSHMKNQKVTEPRYYP